MAEPQSTHLGDGAYASTGDYHGEIILTANHHDRAQASDAVALGPREVQNLIEFLKTVGYHVELTCRKGGDHG